MVTLADPLRLPCGAVLRNRLAKAAMTEGLADPLGRATPGLSRLYGLWSDGGAGLLITGNVQIDGRHLERAGNVILEGPQTPAAMSRLKDYARAGTRAGNHLFMQISHAGRQTQTTINPHPKAPSAVPLALPGKLFGDPAALTEEEIAQIVERFGEASEIAKEAGFTGVQVHAAHGYLLSEFLSPRANLRTDRYGGSLENRARLLLDIVARVRRGVGAAYPVSVKLNSADFQKGGFAFEDSIQVAKWLEAAGVDLLEISGGSYEQASMMGAGGDGGALPVKASTRAREAYFTDFARALRETVSMPLMVTGGFRTRAGMLDALDSGATDVIGLGRPLCVMTDGPARLLAGEPSLPSWETRLTVIPSWLGFLKGLSLVQALEGFAPIYWFYAQLDSLARRGRPNPSIAPLLAFFRVNGAAAKWLKARAKAQAKT
jgi:2,4-dienoyl-CoA reductase-like NADH-dependent reductase (Old Yellow Enzyme family)